MDHPTMLPIPEKADTAKTAEIDAHIGATGDSEGTSLNRKLYAMINAHPELFYRSIPPAQLVLLGMDIQNDNNAQVITLLIETCKIASEQLTLTQQTETLPSSLHELMLILNLAIRNYTELKNQTTNMEEQGFLDVDVMNLHLRSIARHLIAFVPKNFEPRETLFLILSIIDNIFGLVSKDDQKHLVELIGHSLQNTTPITTLKNSKFLSVIRSYMKIVNNYPELRIILCDVLLQIIEILHYMHSSPIVCSILGIYMEFSTKSKILGFFTRDDGRLSQALLSLIQSDLTSTNIQSRKESVYLIQTLVQISSSFSEEELDKLSKYCGYKYLLLELNKEDLNTFWVDYFSLYDILNEKSIHIIEPYLSKYDNLQKISQKLTVPQNATPWLQILLHKMINHDNRIIVATGINKCFEVGTYPSSWPSKAHREKYKEFLKISVFPILKKHVGSWIFPDGEQLYTKAKEFGKLLTHLYHDLEIKDCGSLNAWRSITDELLSERGLNSFSLLFFMETLSKSFEMDVNLCSKICPSDICVILQSMYKVLEYSAPSGIDRYVGSLIEHTLIKIFVTLLTANAHCTIQVYKEYFVPIFEFLGRLSRPIFLQNIESLGSIQKYNWLDQLETQARTMKNEDTPLIRGLGRLIFLTFINNNSSPIPWTWSVDLLGLSPFEFLRCLDSYYCGEEKFIMQSQNIGHWYFVDALMNFIHGKYINRQYDYFEDRLRFDDILEFWADMQNRTLDETNKKEFIQKIVQIHQADYVKDELSKFYPKLPILHFIFKNKINDRGEIPLDLTMTLCIIENLECRSPNEKILIHKIITLPFVLESIKLEINTEESWLEFHSNYAWGRWKNMFIEKTPEFLESLKGFFEYILSLPSIYPEFIDLWKPLYEKYSNLVFEEDAGKTPGISAILIQAIYSETIKDQDALSKLITYPEILKTCIRGSYFGNALLKKNRATFSILEYLSKFKDPQVWVDNDKTYKEHYMNPDFFLTGDARARFQAIQICCLSVKSAGDNWKVILESFVTHLLDKNDEETKRHKRYYENSSTHRIKNRISQALLVLQPLFDHDIATYVNVRLLKSLTEESPQPSVRYFMEWIIMRNLLRYPDLRGPFLETVKELCKKRPGVAAFITTICIHVCLKLDPNAGVSTDSFYKESLKLFISFLMGQHLVVRVYASIAFQKLHSYITETLKRDEVAEYKVIYDTLVIGSLTSSGNFNKLTDGVQDDFWLNHFDPVDDFNLEMIYLELPQLCEVLSDEILQKHHFIEFETSRNNSFWLRTNGYMVWPSTNKFCKTKTSFYKLRSHAGSGRELAEIEPLTLDSDSTTTAGPNGQANLQKKINPWKMLPVSEHLSDFSKEMQKMKNPTDSEDGLIVVASLIDRIPNLGGLCRTSEVFNVSKYVVSSLNVILDQEFKSCSVSAQSWIDMIEVPVKDLEVFLKTYSSKGYHILGIEQAEGSISLNNYKFPKKSILLLGNEKYGIPTKLLHLVDQCLEIPQAGVIRSLNVHVTGSLCIWQYAMQHVI